jgi:hypothetical protein
MLVCYNFFVEEVLFFAKQVPATEIVELSLRHFTEADALAPLQLGTEQMFQAIPGGGMKL